MPSANIRGVSRSGAVASRPPVTAIAQRGSTPSKRAGSASAVPTMKCVIADAIALPKADRLPPQHSHAEPNDEIHKRDQEAYAPPFALFYVSCVEVNRRRARSIVRHRRV